MPASGVLRPNTDDLYFGEYKWGDTSPKETVTFTNVGNLPLSISKIEVVGYGKEHFAWESDFIKGALQVREPRSGTVTFSPKSGEDGYLDAKLQISHDGFARMLEVGLGGRAYSEQV
jgi:hypothetical protein